MRFALSAEQRQFAASLHDLLAAADVPAAARAWADGDHAPGLAVWRRLIDLDVTALAVDADPIDVVVAMEVIGHHALPGPAVESIAVAPALVPDCKPLVTLAHPPDVPYALDADIAEQVFLVRNGMVHVGEPGEAQTSVDPARRLFPVTAGIEIGPAPDVFDRGVLACAAQQLGAGTALLARTTEYAKQRTQFGRPIGAFQAVKHQLADTLIALELARPLVHGAAITQSPADISAAKIAAGNAANRAARTALQIHGALGYTAEYDLSRFLTKTRALYSAWGTGTVHRARILRLAS